MSIYLSISHANAGCANVVFSYARHTCSKTSQGRGLLRLESRNKAETSCPKSSGSNVLARSDTFLGLFWSSQFSVAIHCILMILVNTI